MPDSCDFYSVCLIAVSARVSDLREPPSSLSAQELNADHSGIQLDLRRAMDTELELEPRALHLHVPALYTLDVDLDLPDAALPPSPPATRAALELKRARDLDVDGARAEWRVAEGRLLLFA